MEILADRYLYFLKNEKWYTEDEDGKYHLTDKAPKKARNSYIEYYGSEDPKKRSPYYFLSNSKWYKINKTVLKGKKFGTVFELTSKAPPEAAYSWERYYSGYSVDKPYFMRKKSWYTIDEQGKPVLTDKAPLAAWASYVEYKLGGVLVFA